MISLIGSRSRVSSVHTHYMNMNMNITINKNNNTTVVTVHFEGKGRNWKGHLLYCIFRECFLPLVHSGVVNVQRHLVWIFQGSHRNQLVAVHKENVICKLIKQTMTTPK